VRISLSRDSFLVTIGQVGTSITLLHNFRKSNLIAAKTCVAERSKQPKPLYVRSNPEIAVSLLQSQLRLRCRIAPSNYCQVSFRELT
jgi:hypothetical protein